MYILVWFNSWSWKGSKN